MGNACATNKATATKDASEGNAKPEQKAAVAEAAAPAPEEKKVAAAPEEAVVVEEVKEEEAKEEEVAQPQAEEEQKEEEAATETETETEAAAEETKADEAEASNDDSGDAAEETSADAADAAGDDGVLDEKSEIDAAIVIQLLKGDDEDFQAIVDSLDDKEVMAKWWSDLDHNGNGIVSLSEITKFVEDKNWEVKAPALHEAYKFATAKGDDFVQKKEFPRLLRGMIYMNRLWDLFDDIDTSDDRRMSLDEFKAAFKKLGYEVSDAAAEAAFDGMDKNDGGMVLFGEFGLYVARLAHPNAVEFDDEE